MDETTQKSVITAVEIIILLLVLYIISELITGYLDSLETELIITALKSTPLLI
jgi:hypothetical protein